ncbi:hypothetical protein [Gordonia crocea]|uniref:Uncharacterized protein n=1 Tax=Gordonia crocea TaxID=589162 RepID=A0A7M4BQ73_9ACTN|nr:hypothetical protein [Gordonia crocea]GED96034.1 hypothetical protein nbrc107697_00730 [Gordonia crocea]
MRTVAPALVIGAAVAASIAAAGIADARTAPAGATVEYGWTSDEVQNEISFYGRDGKLVKRQVRFRYLPVGFGPEKFGYGVRIQVPKKQAIGSRATSSGAFSSCTIKVNGTQVATHRNNGTGTSHC